MGKGHFETAAYWIRANQARFLALSLLAVLAGAITACPPDQSHDLAFEQVLPLCNEFFHPNSIARPPDFDLSGHQDDLSRQIREHAAQFSTPAGVRYLRGRLDREPDDLARAYLRRLLEDLREGAT